MKSEATTNQTSIVTLTDRSSIATGIVATPAFRNQVIETRSGLLREDRGHRMSLSKRFARVALFVLTCLFGSYAFADTAFAITSFTRSIDENDTDLSHIASGIATAINDAAESDFVYALDAAGKARFNFNVSNYSLTFKNLAFNFENTRSFNFKVVSTKRDSAPADAIANSLAITLMIRNVEEKPFALAPFNAADGKVYLVQREPNVGTIPLLAVSSILRDPEGHAIQLKPCADDFEVKEYEVTDPTASTSLATRGGFSTDVNSSGVGSAVHCADPRSAGYDAATDVRHGGQVVNVTAFGQTIQIRPITGPTKGVRKAEITFRGWVGTPVKESDGSLDANNSNVSDEAKITVYVKTGVNNPPSFAATGFRANVNETRDNQPVDIGPQPQFSAGSWNATDLDKNDKLSYRLEGSSAPAGCATVDGKTMAGAVAIGRGCVWLDPTALANNPPNVQIRGKNLDFESAPLPNREYTIFVVASDGFASSGSTDAARVPITIRILNVEEGLEFSGPIGEIRELVIGRVGRTVDLNAHFSDPDGLPITYAVLAVDPTIVSVVLTGSVLTVSPVGRAGNTSITITARTAANELNVQNILIRVRASNQRPEFVGSVLSIRVPTPIRETQATGFLIRILSLKYSDPDGDTVTATALNTSLFEAVADPTFANQKRTGEIGLRLVGRLDFETSRQHAIQVQLEDGWDTSERTVNIIVDVADVNEAPQIATDAQGFAKVIPDQTVSIGSTQTINVAEFFVDPDGGRLLINAVATTGSSYARIQMLGQSTIQFEGIQTTGDAPITVIVTAQDSGGLSVETRFLLTVSANTPPRLVQTPPAQTLREGQTAKFVSLIGTFTDDDPGDRIARFEASSSDESILLVQVSSDGTAVVLIARSEGTTNVVITAIDTRGGSATTSFDVTVLSNSAPVIEKPVKTVNLRPNGSETIDLRQHFTDPDGDTLTFTASIDKPGIATAKLANNRYLTVQAHTRGTAEVTVTATDPDRESVSSSFLVAVINDAPVIKKEIATNLTYRGDSQAVDLTTIFSDPDNDTMTYTAFVANAGTATASISGTSLLISATAIGTTQVTVTARDSFGAATSTSFSVTIVNRDPTLNSKFADVSGFRHTPLEIQLAPKFADPDGDELGYTIAVANGRIATATVRGSMLTLTGVLLGTTGVTVTAQDQFGGSVSTEFNFTVENRGPEAIATIPDQTLYRGADNAKSIDLTTIFSDPDNDTLNYSVNVAVSRAVKATINGNELRLEGISLGSSSITVTASDTSSTTATTSFAVTVENRAPLVVKEISDQATFRHGTVSINLGDVFEDPDGDPLRYFAEVTNGAVVSTSIQGSKLNVTGLTVNTTRVTVTANDEFGASVSTNFQITVANRAPTVVQEPDDLTMNRTKNADVDLSGVFADPDEDKLRLSVNSSKPGVARATVSDQSLLLEPLMLGTTTLTLKAEDPYNASATASFEVTVENLAPRVAAPMANVKTNRKDESTLDLAGVFVDDDGDSFTLTADSANTRVATVAVSGTSLTLRGVALGTTDVTVTATDAHGASVSATFQVVVENLAPTVAAELASISLQLGGEATTVDVTGTFEDDESTPLVLTVAISNAEIATAAVSGMALTVTPVSRGVTSVTVTATDAQGANVTQAASITVSDSELKNVAGTALASFSRAVLASISSTVGARLLADADGLYTPFDMYSFDDFLPTEEFVQPVHGFMHESPFASSQSAWKNGPAQAGSTYYAGGLDNASSLLGRGFAMKLGATGDPTFWSVWGGADRQSFEGANHEGNASSFYFGGDMTIQGQWTFGLAVGKTAGEADYTFGTASQTMENSLTSILPYARMSPSDRTTIYGTFGFGSGEVETTVIGAGSELADLKATMGLIGLRQVMFTMPNGLNLAIVGDYGFANLETDEGSSAASSLLAEVTRFRGGVESSMNLAMGADGSFSPFLNLSFRSDGGDGDADSGMELSGGLRIANPVFSLDANFRTLATYGVDDYSESGFAMMAVLNPSAGATGLNLSIAPRWGTSAISTNALWQDDYQPNQFQDLSTWGFMQTSKLTLDSTIGYGFLVVDERFVLTPFIDVQTGYTNGYALSIGAKLAQFTTSNHPINIDLKIGQDSSQSGRRQDSLLINARVNF